MSELFTVHVHDKYVRVLKGTQERNISHGDFFEIYSSKIGLLNSLANKQEEFTGGYVTTYPESFLFETTLSATKKNLFLYHKESSIPIQLDLSEGAQFSRVKDLNEAQILTALAEAGVSYHNHHLTFKTMRMPNIVCRIPLTKQGAKGADGEKWTVGIVKYGFTDVPRAMAVPQKKDASLKDVIPTLGWLPFPNTYEEGGLCYGSNKTIVNVEQDRFKDLEQYMHFITAIPYNFHVAGGRNISGPARKVPQEDSIDAYLASKGVEKFRDRYTRHFDSSYYDILNWFFYLNKQTAFPFHFFK